MSVPLMRCQQCAYVYVDAETTPSHQAGTSTFRCKGSGEPGIDVDIMYGFNVEIVDEFGETCWEGIAPAIPGPGDMVEYDHDDDGVCNLDGVVRSVTHNVNSGHITVCLEARRC